MAAPKQTSAATAATVRRVLRRVQRTTYRDQTSCAIASSGDSAARSSLSGTLPRPVTPKVPIRYARAPLSRQADDGSFHDRTARAASAADANAVPMNAPRNERLITTSLIDCIAAMPAAAGKRRSPPMMKLEKAKNVPAISAEPSVASPTRKTVSVAIVVTLPSRPSSPRRRVRSR